MNPYLNGVDVLGAEASDRPPPRPVPASHRLTWWERGAIVVGGLASLTTLVQAVIIYRERKRK